MADWREDASQHIVHFRQRLAKIFPTLRRSVRPFTLFNRTAHMTNPLLTPFSLPPFSAIKPEHVVPAVTKALDDWASRSSGLFFTEFKWLIGEKMRPSTSSTSASGWQN
jgi:hypothetical protein